MSSPSNPKLPRNGRSLNRREAIKLAGLGLGSLALRPFAGYLQLPEFVQAEKLGRVTVGMVELKARPDPDATTLGVLYEDAVIPWLRETVGLNKSWIFNNQRWVETPQGYVYGPYLQPVENLPNLPVKDLQQTSIGQGMWVEVTVPYAEVLLANTPSSNSWVEARLEEGNPIRVYYSQVFWVDQIKTGQNGQVLYRINPNYYGGVDLLWVAAQAFRPITQEDLQPIHPDVEDKRVEIDVNHQVLSCYEGKDEVFFCRVSTGAKYDMFGNLVDKWATPLGPHIATRKFISLQMSGGTTGAGYDLPGIGWTVIFATGGVAIHSTFWHNNYGDPVSHGCVNTSPQDAKWLFRWIMPTVAYDPGMLDVTLSKQESTPIKVIEG